MERKEEAREKERRSGQDDVDHAEDTACLKWARPANGGYGLCFRSGPPYPLPPPVSTAGSVVRVVCVRWSEKKRERERMHESEKQSERKRMRRGGEKVTVACRRVLDVVSGRPAWPVARGPWPGLCPRRNAARGPRRKTERKREREGRKIGGVDSVKESKRERKPGGGRAERVLPRTTTLPCLLVEAPPKGSYSFFLLVPSRSLFLSLFLSAFLSLPRALLCARTHARSCARVVGRVALSPGDVIKGFPRGARRGAAAYFVGPHEILELWSNDSFSKSRREYRLRVKNVPAKELTENAFPE
ncbi:hypothetical protein DBV15_04597 [Temnothorax longispinosus]|uniref:Uncharacterized protein n=1 Tax=Temnothorax longispinosus TaxID=300112 RepID=A0A4S2L235_9HYME|nr:hypothetical protein DBV15_04597 [Temnothorax longispinosus]